MKKSRRDSRSHRTRCSAFPSPRDRFRRLVFDRLEERQLLATIVVSLATNLSDGDTSSIANLISSPGGDGGISLREAITAANNTTGADRIEFNFSGTISPTSTSLLPGISEKLEIDGVGHQIELNGSGAPGANGLQFVGGTGSAVRNLTINRFFFGIVVRDGAANTVIDHNFIGTNIAGDTAQPNFIGIGLLLSASGTQITNNVVSGNSFAGIAVGAQSVVANGQQVTGTTIKGNYIGTNSLGADLGNNSSDNASGGGISINSAEQTQIGGVGSGEANVIAYNHRAGIVLGSGGGGHLAAGNSFRGNSIHDNIGLGIDLVTYVPVPVANTPVFGITPNDPDDVDTGSNGLQNFPELLVATSGTSTHLEGTLNSIAGQTFTLDFYANAAIESAGYEGRRYLGSATATTDANGDAYFIALLPAASTTGEFITATATDANGNTSEFSAEFVVSDPSAPEQAGTITISSGATDTNAEVDQVVAAVNALPPQTGSPLTIELNLAAGVTYGGLVASPPAGVTLIINGDGGTTTIEGHSPALTVTSGTVIVTGMNFTNSTDAPTILVTGGTLQMRNSTVHETTGGNRAALEITGGTVDLGTAADPGGNTLVVEGPGVLILNPSLAPLTNVGNTEQVAVGFSAAAQNSGAQIEFQQSDGKLLVVASNQGLFRLNADFSQDATFGSGVDHTFSWFSPQQIQTQGGSIYLLNGSQVARLTAAGTFDSTFGVGGIAETGLPSDAGSRLVVTNTGIVFVAVKTHSQQDGQAQISLARLNNSGQLLGQITTWSPPPPSSGINYELNLVDATTLNGKAVLLVEALGTVPWAGFQSDCFALLQFNANGTLDAAASSFVSGKALSFPDRIVPGVEDYLPGMRTFSATGIGAVGEHLIVVGTILDDNGNQALGVRRFHQDGSLDFTYGTAGDVLLSSVNEASNLLHLTGVQGWDGQADGKLAIWAQETNHPELSTILRLSADGSLDTSFDANGVKTVANDATAGIALDAAGHINLVGTRALGGSLDVLVTRLMGDDSISTSHVSAAQIGIFSSVVRGETVSLTVAATDANAAVEAAGFEFVVNWGDGSPVTTISQSAGNASGVNAQHIYHTAGSFTVQATATNINNQSSSASENVTVADAIVRGGDVLVGGTTGDDTLAVNENGGQVIVNGQNSNPLALSRRLVVFLGGGSDILDVSATGDVFGSVYGTESSDTFAITTNGAGGLILDDVVAGGGDDHVTLNDYNAQGVVFAYGGAGNDTATVNANAGIVLVQGDDGNDTLTAADVSGSSSVNFAGNSGQDTLTTANVSGAAYIAMLGGSGSDIFTLNSSGTGGTSLDGQEGADAYTVNFGGWSGLANVNDSGTSGADTIIFNGTYLNETFEKQTGFVQWNATGIPAVTARVDFAGFGESGETITLNAAAGNDTIHDPGSNTIILGGPGDDTITIDASYGSGVAVDGGAGSDVYIIGGGNVGDLAGPVAVADTGTTGVDTVTVLGTTGNDSIYQTSSGFSLNTTPIAVTGLESATVNGGGGTDAVVATGTPPVPVQVVGVTDMVVVGTIGNDQILFNPGSKPGEIVAKLNGVIVSRFVPTGKLVAYGGAGNDEMQVAGSINLAAWLYGEGGNDRLNTGNGGGLLIGGDGNDDLSGGNGRDIMIGGQGADKLLGNSGDDILIAGFTLRDDRTAAGHDAFWQSVLSEWNSIHNFTTRVKNLKGANAGYTGALLLPEVRDDFFADQVDFLNGAAGDDWLIFQVGEDKVTGQAEASN